MAVRTGPGKAEEFQLRPDEPIRERLMKSALRLFTQRGYSATTVRELVGEAGVTKPVLYYYFGSKEGLFLELMQTHFNHIEAMFDTFEEGEGDVRNHMMAFLDRGFLHVRENRDFIRLMHAVYFGPPGEAPFFDFDAYHQRFHDRIAHFLEEGIRRGEIRPGDTGDMAWVILGTMEIALEDQICSQEPRIDRETLKRLLTLVFDGLATETRKGKEEYV
jgi:TetR/AcrR family transcriptional regulator